MSSSENHNKNSRVYHHDHDHDHKCDKGHSTTHKANRSTDPLAPSILFIRFSSLGDIVLTTGVIKAAKDALPNATISVITKSQYYHVFEACDFVDNIYTIPNGIKFHSYRCLLRHIRKNITFDYIVDLHRNIRSRMLGLCFRKARLKKYRKNSLARRFYTKTKIHPPWLNEHVVLRYYKCLYAALKPLRNHPDIDANALPSPETVSMEQIMPHMNRVGKARKEILLEIEKLSDPTRPLILLAPFASKKTKYLQNYTQIMGVLAESYNVALVGNSDTYSPLDMSLYNSADTANSGKTTVIGLVGRLELPDLFHLISIAHGVVSADSGIAHASPALGTPLVMVFCSTDTSVGFTPCYGIYETLEVDTLKCRPCGVFGKNTCKRGDFACSTLITPQMVANKVRDVLQYSQH